MLNQQPLPADLLFDIDNFQGISMSSTPEGILTPKHNLSTDDLDDVVNKPNQSNANSNSNLANKTQNYLLCADEKENTQVLPREIPKSPHLGKDFSPTGERIRDSMRARRRQRLLEAQQQRGLTPENQKTDKVLEAVKHSLQHGSGSSRRNKPYGEKGFLLDINKDGNLHLNNVKDLNNCSDFDSSCDTSLNYHEVNAVVVVENEHSNAAEPTRRMTPRTLLLDHTSEEDDEDLSSKTSKEALRVKPEIAITVRDANTTASSSQDTDAEEDAKALKTMEKIQNNIAQKSYRNALDDIRTKLNLCKNKFDSIDAANRKNYTNTQNSMKTFFKINPSEAVYKNPPQALKMFQRLEAAEIHGAAEEEKRPATQTYRVNQTPIFGRKQFPKPVELYTPHSESMENLSAIESIPQIEVPILEIKPNHKAKKDKIPSKRSKSPKEKTFRSYVSELSSDNLKDSSKAELEKSVEIISPKKNKLIHAKDAASLNNGNSLQDKCDKSKKSSLGFSLKRNSKTPATSSKNCNSSLSPTRELCTSIGPTRRSYSPTKASDARRVVVVKQETNTGE